jgi:hypothetical protein
MRTIRSKSGPFGERPYFKLRQIEEMCADALREVGLYPSSPQPIRVDRFIEKKFQVKVGYDDLPEGVLGYTRFGAGGVEAVIVSITLDGGDKVAERRLRSTLAHEGGHGLLHTQLFRLGEKPACLFDDDDRTPRILCRDVTDGPRTTPSYDGRWWEFQANKAIGGLLMPRPLVEMALEKLCVEAGLLGQRVLPPEKREAAARELSHIFDVNPAAARLRLEDVFPKKNDAQLPL